MAMIALGYPISKVDSTDDVRKFAVESLSVAGETDGVEGAMAFQDPSTGDSFTIILYRDQAAADAASREHRRPRRDQREGQGVRH